MANSMLKTAAILGLLSTVGPFAIDMYLPALPTIAQDLNTSVAATQSTITAFFIAFGVAQLFYGPWADHSGRKPPLYLGLCIFIVGSIGCLFSPSIGWLVAFRFLQGLGGAVVMVVPRAIIRDLHTGNEATRLMALVMLVISVSPMLAPLMGSFVIALSGWRAIFLVLCVAALASLAMVRLALPETLTSENRVPFNTRSLLRGSRILFTDRSFMSLTFVGGFGMASFFVFIASSSFVYAGQFGLSPFQFSAAFAVNALGFFTASQMAAPLGIRLGMVRVIALATAGFLAVTLVLLAIALAGQVTLFILIATLFLANACLGLVIPMTMVLALDNHGEIAGLASSLGGTLQMVAGGIMITLVAPFFDGTATPMIVAISICGVGAFIMSRVALLEFQSEKAEQVEQ